MTDTAPPDMVGASADPIFAAIEAHRAAYGDLSRALAVLGKLPPTDPGYEEANAITETVGDEVFRRAHDLAKIVPTTLAKSCRPARIHPLFQSRRPARIQSRAVAL
jgi:hypothetical protein